MQRAYKYPSHQIIKTTEDGQKIKVKRIGVLSAGKIFGLMYAVFGLVFALLFAGYIALISLLGAAFAKSLIPLFPGIIGLMFLVILPVFYGLMGFIFGSLGAFVYNLISSKIGGLEIET